MCINMLKYLYVYILKCSDQSYYSGVTNDVERRLKEHNDGINPKCYTFSRRPVELVYFEYFTDFNQAIAFEKKIKGWTRAKKQALIAEDWDKLKKLSRCNNDTRSGNYSE
ncbi:MAG: GIY-YIG nuclease family protein [Bacteroidota bacterium]